MKGGISRELAARRLANQDAPIPLVLLDRRLRNATGAVIGLRTVLATAEDGPA